MLRFRRPLYTSINLCILESGIRKLHLYTLTQILITDIYTPRQSILYVHMHVVDSTVRQRKTVAILHS